MAGVLIHAVVYVAVNAFLVGVWVVIGGGSSDELQAVRDDPIQGMRDGFWPGYVMATWAVALVIHAGVRAAYALTGTGRRRRRRRRRLAAQRTDKPAPTTVQRGRRWVAVMFTDIAGSTELNEVLGDDAWIGVLDDHRRLVRGHVVAHDGVEIGTQGDGFLVRFDSPASAVDCAIAIQKELAGSRSSGTFTPDLRVGIHAGEATLSDADLVGRVINLAARVAGLAGPGEILVTEPVADHANAHVGFVDRGLQPLRGIAQPRHLLEVAWKDTTPPTPPPAPPPSPKSPSRDSSLVFGANSYVRWWRIPGALAPKDRQHRVAHTANSGSPR